MLFLVWVVFLPSGIFELIRLVSVGLEIEIRRPHKLQLSYTAVHFGGSHYIPHLNIMHNTLGKKWAFFTGRGWLDGSDFTVSGYCTPAWPSGEGSPLRKTETWTDYSVTRVHFLAHTHQVAHNNL